MPLGKTDIVGSIYDFETHERIKIPEGYKVVKYGSVKAGDYERVCGEWVEVAEGKIGNKAITGTFMRRI